MGIRVAVEDEPKVRLISLPGTDGYISLTRAEAKVLQAALTAALIRLEGGVK